MRNDIVASSQYYISLEIKRSLNNQNDHFVGIRSREIRIMFKLKL